MNFRKLIISVLPYGFVRVVQRRRAQAELAVDTAERVSRQHSREQHIQEFIKQRTGQETAAYSYADSIDYLVSLGCNRNQVQDGSMPEASLVTIVDILRRANPGAPLKLLHIGNFVGISLTYLTYFAVAHHAESVVLSVDPNLRHRGIDRPAEMATRLLCRYGVQANSMMLVGYSLEKSISNDGLVLDGRYDPFAQYDNEGGCERQLDNLIRLGFRGFDAAVLDGNHETSYLAREIEAVYDCLREGGLLVLDDVSPAWANIQGVYERAKQGMAELFADGRVGVLVKGTIRPYAQGTEPPQTPPEGTL